MVSVHTLKEDDSPCRGMRRTAAATGAARVPCLLALFWRAALHPRGVRTAWASTGRTVVGGFCTCQWGNPFRVVAPMGVLGGYGAPPAWEAPGRLATAAASALRRVLVSPWIQGCPRCCAPAWSHGCAGRRAGATASVVHSFHPGCRPPICAMSRVATFCHWSGWSMVAGGVCPMAVVRWPKVMSAMVRVPSARWRDCEVSSHQMRTARASCSPAVNLGIHRPRYRAAACSAWSLGRLVSPSKLA